MPAGLAFSQNRIKVFTVIGLVATVKSVLFLWRLKFGDLFDDVVSGFCFVFELYFCRGPKEILCYSLWVVG